MRIALISFEFPPSVAIGGIGAYAWEAAIGLAGIGHDVEVFAAGDPGEEPSTRHGVLVHRVAAESREVFRERLIDVFRERHTSHPFDVLESPEIGAEAWLVAERHPEIARVVKLHTPSYLIGEVAWEEPSLVENLRFSFGALRRGKWDSLSRPLYQADADSECRWARMADEVAAPCAAIAHKVTGDWNLDEASISTFPLPYHPPVELLSLPVPEAATTVGFLGRLEPRKGVLEMVSAIPAILRKAPATRFRFLGPSWPYRRSDMETWIRRNCAKFLPAIDFRGAVARQDLAREMAACDIMLLPSRWENFPFACWESMASGRAVIGSAAGGMADVIEEGKSGLLVQPRSPEDIAVKVLSLLGDPEKIRRLGEAGRQRVSEFLNPQRILPLQVASYERAIHRAKARLLDDR